MRIIRRPIVRKIQGVYHDLTSVERDIADFFINNTEIISLSSKNVSQLLYVSEASLSRFSKKCGFSGFREFVYEYQREINSLTGSISTLTHDVIELYGDILMKFEDFIVEEQVAKLYEYANSNQRIYVYGIGSSGYVAREFAVRLSKAGYQIEAITDIENIKVHCSKKHEDALIIGISLSGKTNSVLEALIQAKENQNDVVLMTSRSKSSISEVLANVILVPTIQSLTNESMISPQFPLLVITDIIYSYFAQQDRRKHMK